VITRPTMASNRILLKDRSFEVESATVGARVPDPNHSNQYNYAGLTWILEIDAMERIFDNVAWRPGIYHDSLRLPVRRWTDIVGRELRWTSSFDEQTGKPNGSFYVFEHAEIVEASLRFLDRDRRAIHILWTGLCNVFWGDEYGVNVPFEVDAWLSFAEIIVNGSERDTDESLRERLVQHIDVKDFVQQPMQLGTHTYEDGIKMAHGVFTPIDQSL
jgi:hypothetical protein